MKLTTLSELEDEVLGPIGTPERDDYEAKLAEELHAYHVGESIKPSQPTGKRKKYHSVLYDACIQSSWSGMHSRHERHWARCPLVNHTSYATNKAQPDWLRLLYLANWNI